MMKILKFPLILILYFVTNIAIFAKEVPSIDIQKPWRLERTNFYFENDAFFNTDNQYSFGFKLSNVYFVPKVEYQWLKIPFIHKSKEAHFVSMGISQQMYTPKDIESSKLIVDDRPYAGWLYLEFGLYQSTKAQLDSLTLQFGIIGENSGAEFVQRKVHELIGSQVPNGWNNQLNNELGVNLIYQHKWRFVPEPVFTIESNIVPFVEATLGNVKTQVSTGALMRFGLNPIEDFGSSSIDVGGENGIPIRTNCLCPQYKPWSFTLNFAFAAKAVAHNIFLDGNSFSESHSVEKENFIAYVSYGFSARYEHFAIDYVLTSYSRQYKTEEKNHEYGSILFSYLY